MPLHDVQNSQNDNTFPVKSGIIAGFLKIQTRSGFLKPLFGAYNDTRLKPGV
jgi:hypothetical protein